MNKIVFGIAVVAILAVALGVSGVAFAQSETPSAALAGTGYGPGMGQSRGARGGMMGQVQAGAQSGLLHDEMVAAFADQLGISVDELEAKLAEGQTVADIALAQGLTSEEFFALKDAARSQAVEAAVANGTITQEQADWMAQAGQRGAGMGRGNRGAARGTGLGLNANPDCPYYQANP